MRVFHEVQEHVYIYICISTGYICYDDACHLKRYALHPDRSQQTKTAQRLAELGIVVDKLHFKGHVDPWCKEHCNPYACADLDKVKTKIGVNYML